MARSVKEELRHAPHPAQLAKELAQQETEIARQPSTDAAHVQVRARAVRSKSSVFNVIWPQQAFGCCVSHDEAPPYLRREFILSGYYIGGTHLASARRTLFGWNNETLNAWTMVMGLVATLAFWAYARQLLPQYTAAFALMAASALPHAPFSIALHATIGVSQRTRDFLRTLDVFFILTCAVPRGLALAWFVFSSQRMYTAYASVIVIDWGWSVLSTCVTRHIKDIPKEQLARDVSAIVLCYLSPLLWAANTEIWQQGFPGVKAALAAAVAALLYAAGWCYSRHLPERWRPGAYDLVGNSHQIMHTLVVAEYCLEWCFLLHCARLAAAASPAAAAATALATADL